MTMQAVAAQETLDRIRQAGLLAVIRGPDPELTVKMVDALIAGGVSGIEITYTTPNAAEVVAALARAHGDAIVLGMGTLLEPFQAEEALVAGARFLVSPHTDPALAQAMAATGLPFMLGALTPSEVVAAHKLGSSVVKIFPGSLGGPAYLKSLRAPLPHIRMMPTGGVSADNVGEWLAAGAFAVGAGSELCPPAWAKEGRFAAIRERAAAFVAAVHSAQAAR